MSEPYIPFYAADYLADTMHLSLEEHGAYLKLLFVMWRAGGELDDDDKKVCAILGITPRKWATLKPTVSKFFDYYSSKFSQKRLRAEQKKVEEKIQKRAYAGAIGGKTKAMKNKEAGLANATDLLPVLPEQTPSNTRGYLEPELELDKKEKNTKKDNAESKGSRFTLASLPAEWKEFCLQERPDLDPEKLFAEFRDYWISVPGAKGRKLDWFATWRNRVRDKPRQQGFKPPEKPKQKVTAMTLLPGMQ